MFKCHLKINRLYYSTMFLNRYRVWIFLKSQLCQFIPLIYSLYISFSSSYQYVWLCIIILYILLSKLIIINKAIIYYSNNEFKYFTVEKSDPRASIWLMNGYRITIYLNSGKVSAIASQQNADLQHYLVYM